MRERCPSDQGARRWLDTIAEEGVDVLDYCALRMGLGYETVLERVAEWTGLAYAPFVPRTVSGPLGLTSIDLLARVRSLRGALWDREVLFVAPSFSEAIGLKRYAERNRAARSGICLVPAQAIRTELAEANTAELTGQARHRLTRRWPAASAEGELPRKARIGFVLGLAMLLGLAIYASLVPIPALTLGLCGLLLIPALLRVIAMMEALVARRRAAPPVLETIQLPLYSLLVPLRDEAHMVPLLARAMAGLDYPPEKLDIIFVVESRSASTVAACREAVAANPLFNMIVVPESLPHTKPKALNFALPFVRGEFVVVYDAEDIPDADQLRLAAARFAADPGIDCLQAELAVDNAGETWLTALFAGEYAGQFGLMLPTLAALALPMPLGGTSNHFRTRSLRELGGWDAFNVTEDADLGVRLSRLRYRSETLDSWTLEEAPVSLRAWMAQRTRWMKGWMQTLIVHNAHPAQFLADIGWRGFVAFQIYVGSMIVSALLHTAFLFGIGLKLALTGTLWPGGTLGAIYLVILAVGYGSALALAAAGLWRSGRSGLIPYQLLLPVYWLLHSVATLRAAQELLTRPYFWAKTPHGRTRLERTFAERR